MSPALKLSLLSLTWMAGLFWPWTNYGAELRISALDVGQGDSILISTPSGYRILIDGGPTDTVVDQLDQQIPFWDRKVDVIMSTHPHADHVNGLVEVVRRFKVDYYFNTPDEEQLASYESLKKEVEQLNITNKYFIQGDKIDVGDGVVIRSLWPKPGSSWEDSSDPNDSSQMVILEYGPFRALFTGDAGAKINQELLTQRLVANVDLLKVAHHGSATGHDLAYLQAIDPEISVISVGAGNTYGHPSPSTLAQLSTVGSAIWRTDIQGRIEVRVNQSGISVSSTK